MALGYETYDDNRNFEQEGLTGNVRRYVTESMTFPCFILVAEEDKQVEIVKIKVLKQMAEVVETYNEEEANSLISVYFSSGDKTAYLGKIQPRQVKSFISLFSTNTVVAYYDKETLLEGDMRYVLAN